MVTKDEQWQQDVLLGINRLLEVLHDISDTAHATHLLLKEQGQQTAAPAADDQDGDRLLNTEETAQFLGITRSQIYGTFRVIGPQAIKLGKRRMYRKSDLTAWLDAKRDLRTDGVATVPTRVHDPRPLATGYRPHKDRPNCAGSGSEPTSTNQWGDGKCRVCDQWIRKRNNGTLVKHKTPPLYF